MPRVSSISPHGDAANSFPCFAAFLSPSLFCTRVCGPSPSPCLLHHLQHLLLLRNNNSNSQTHTDEQELAPPLFFKYCLLFLPDFQPDLNFCCFFFFFFFFFGYPILPVVVLVVLFFLLLCCCCCFICSLSFLLDFSGFCFWLSRFVCLCERFEPRNNFGSYKCTSEVNYWFLLEQRVEWHYYCFSCVTAEPAAFGFAAKI